MVSAFIKFSQAKRAEILAANPGAGFGEIGKLLGAAWRGLSDAEKASYAGGKTVKSPRKTRKNKGTHRAKPIYGKENIMKAPVAKKSATRKGSAYAMFVKDHQADVKAQNPGASFGDISRKIATMWKATK